MLCAVCCLEENMEGTPHRKAAVRPLISHLTNHSSQMNKICEAAPEKQGRTHKQGSLIDMPVLADQQRLSDTGCSQEDSPRVRDDWNVW